LEAEELYEKLIKRGLEREQRKEVLESSSTIYDVINNDENEYLIDIYVGSNKDVMDVTLDTGSDWVIL
jgi:hypothetical protein